MSTATYLYCLVRSPRAPALGRAPAGLPGAGRPRALDAGGGLWLVACDAPLDRYGAAPIERGLRDLEWVSACAIGHEAVVEHAARRGTVVPMKLFTLFTSDARALAHVRRIRRRVERVLERVAGRAEWGVRIAADERPGRRPAAAAAGKAPGRRTGTGFLLRKRAEREAADRLDARVRSEVGRAAAEIARLADAVRRRGRAGPGPGGRRLRLLLDAAYLVRSSRAGRFRAAVRQAARRLAGSGCEMTLSGPWPPYSFVEGAR